MKKEINDETRYNDPTYVFVEEDKILTTLFDEGMDNLHLYKPGASPMYSERLLSLLPEAYYNKITVHDHYYLKNEYGLAGIHIDNKEKEIPKDYKGKFSRTCTSINDLYEIKKKLNMCFYTMCLTTITKMLKINSLHIKT